jgi:tripartite-type tricarboxylate transporter receptor subunit TctC
MAVNPSLYDQLPYDPLKDFSPITNMVNFPLWLVSHPAVPAKTTLELIRQVKSDQLKKIAMGSAKRVPYLADIPTISESGLPGCEAYSWVAILAPAKTPRDIVMRLNRKWRTS